MDVRIDAPVRRAARRGALVVLALLFASLSAVPAPAPVAAQRPQAESSFADPAADAAPQDPPAALLPPLAGAATGYHLNIRPGFQHLARFTVPNAQSATVVGSQTAFIFGMDYDGSVVWGLNQASGQVGTISEADGSFAATAPISGRGANETMNGFTIGPDGVFYVSTSDGTVARLYTLKPNTGALTLVGPIGNAALVIALAMNCAGELYGHEVNADVLLRIPPANPAGATVIGPTGQNAGFAQGMDFDDSTGILYGWLYRSGGAGDFVSFNTATGAATAITPLTGEFEGFIKTTCANAVRITSALPAAGRYGQPYRHDFTTTGPATTTLSLSGALPPGLVFDSAGVISGTPTLAGIYPGLSVSVVGSPSATQAFTLTIAKAPLTATALPATRRVGQANPTFLIEVTGLVGMDNPTVVNVLPTAQSPATPLSPVGTYPIIVSGGSDENYEFIYQPGTLTVTRGAWYLPIVTTQPPALPRR